MESTRSGAFNDPYYRLPRKIWILQNDAKDRTFDTRRFVPDREPSYVYRE